MQSKQKYRVLKILIFTILVIGTITILSLVFLGHIPQKTSPQSQLYIRYHYTTEATYQDIEINKSRLIYTYFPEEIAKEKCASWIIQSPCWTEKDLKTKEAILSEDEVNDLTSLINETDFMNLKNTYGGASQYQRYYPHTLFVKIGEKQKEVVYQSFPGASPMPKAFKKVKDKLFELIDKKFK